MPSIRACGMPVKRRGSCTAEETTTIRAGASAASRSSSRLVSKKWPRWFTAKVASKPSRLRTGPRANCRPALQTSALRDRPRRSISRASVRTEVESERSSVSASAHPGPCRAPRSRATASEAGRSRLAIRTRHPSRTRTRVHSRPMPELPPVRRTVRACMISGAGARIGCGAQASQVRRHHDGPVFVKCEEGDLNPHGCYPTSPSN